MLLTSPLLGCRNAVDSVDPDRLDQIELVGGPTTIGSDEAVTIQAHLLREDGTWIVDREVEWTSSDLSVATLSGAAAQSILVIAVAPGKTTITAVAGDKTASVEITVIIRPPPVPLHAFVWSAAGMIDLGVLPGQTVSMARAINDSGEVTGTSGPYASGPYAFVWSPKTGMTAIDPLPNGSNISPSDINNLGQVTGDANVGGVSRGFVWSRQDGFRDIGVLPGAQAASARAINDDGVVVGHSLGRPFRWTPAGGMQELGIFLNYTGAMALDINAVGQIVGYNSNRYDPAQRAVLWTSDGQPTEVTCCFASARGINRSGDVAGTFGSTFRAFVWTKSGGTTEVVLPPGMTGATGEGINDSGQVTGWVFGPYIDRAYIWSRTTGMEVLGVPPGRTRCFGFDINNRGEVAGYCD
jgi:probable HAF family extracellular repeat protein